MTLGGLALAVGVLVDEATVSIENIHTQMLPGVSRARAVVEASSRTAIARLLSMLCILAVFVPSFFMVGVSRQLFVPLSLAVGFAMIASYVLSSTLVPVFSTWLMKEAHRGEEREGLFGRLRSFYESLSGLRPSISLAAGAGLSGGARSDCVVILLPRMGTEIFPEANAPLFRIRLRAPTGTRIEETERIVLRALDVIQREIGAEQCRHHERLRRSRAVQLSGEPDPPVHQRSAGSRNPGFAQTRARSEAKLCAKDCGTACVRELPGAQISFEAGDIVSQVMSFGSPTPIEVAVQGINLQDNYAFAQKVRARMATLRFLRDLQFAQAVDYPTLDINNRPRSRRPVRIDHVRRGSIRGAGHVIIAIHQPNYWRDPNSGNAFQIQVQLPQNRLQGVDEMGNVPVMQSGRLETRLTDVAGLKLGTMPGLIERYNGQRVVSLTANISGVTLGEAAQKLNEVLAGAGTPPRGVTVKFRGQIPPLEQTISGLRIGLLLAVLVIFLLLAANFQSMRLALAIILTIPAVLCGVLVMLLITGTTLNVQSFMGAIMAIGIAVANSILLVTFAERSRHDGMPLLEATREGAGGRLRAILMTAAAMIFGMVPMAIGFGEGGSQSAPLGRAVIGGLIAATFTTLSILPSIYAILQRRASLTSPSLNPMDPASRYYDAA